MLKRTPLWENHRELGARLVDFAGWEMPLHYTGIVDEHLAVRRAAGLFDISHMGNLRVAGPSAERFLDGVLTNDVRRLGIGEGQYTLMCNERGGAIDDLYAYRLGSVDYLLVVNASRIAADRAWLQQQLEAAALTDGTQVADRSDDTGALALQGPRALAVAERVLAATADEPAQPPLSELARNRIRQIPFRGVSVAVARTGYTGEDGCELFLPAPVVAVLWKALLEAGAAIGLQPCGLGARDTLRTEMGYPLYGHELTEDITPLEAGLGRFVAIDKGDFRGRDVLARQKAEGPARKGVAFRMTGRCAPPRPGYRLRAPEPDGRILGQVTSGTQSPSLGMGIGLGCVPPGFAAVGTALEVEIRGSWTPAIVVAKPIYRKAA